MVADREICRTVITYFILYSPGVSAMFFREYLILIEKELVGRISYVKQTVQTEQIQYILRY